MEGIVSFFGSTFFGGEFFFPDVRLHVGPSVDKKQNKKRWYIIKGRKLLLTLEELAVYLANLALEVRRKDIKVVYATKPARVVSSNIYSALMDAVDRLESVSPVEKVVDESDDEEAILLLM